MKIINIVFDLGRVLIDWQPELYIKEHFGEDIATFFWKHIFNSEEWNLMDKGKLTEEQLWNLFSQRYSNYIYYINHMKEKVPELLIPIQDNIKLLPALKKLGYKLYVLSNFSSMNFDYVYKKFEFFNLFDGMIISSHVHSVKPELRIYECLIEKFNLNPLESLFIDDKIENIQGAQRLQFKVIHLTNPKELKSKLEEYLQIKIF
ncbi:MAG: HAD family hydrolase [Fervidobacterium sp.]